MKIHATRWVSVVAAGLIVGCQTAPRVVGDPSAHPDFDWVAFDEPMFSINVLDGTVGRQKVGQLARSARLAIAELQTRLDASELPHVAIYVVTSRDEVAALAGRAANGMALSAFDAIIVRYPGSIETALRHELMHVFAHSLWGPAGTDADWIVEGVGVYGARTCSGAVVESVAAAWLAAGSLPGLDDVAVAFHEGDEMHNHLAAAGFVAYLVAQYGWQAVAAAYQDGVSGLVRRVGTTLAAMERRWHEWLVTLPPLSTDLAVVERGCVDSSALSQRLSNREDR